MRSIILSTLLLLAPLAAQAQTVTMRDIIDLSKAGLSEEVLLALIEVHRPVFPVDTVTLKSLKDAGVAPKVIIAMIKSGRQTQQVEPAAEAPVALPSTQDTAPPQVVVVEREHHHEEPRVREVAVPVPVYVPVRSRHHDRPRPKPAEPVYWGFGGKLRPDAWKPTAADVQKDAKVPPPQKK